jgi:hypothetical protein
VLNEWPNAQRYHDFLENLLPELLENIPLNVRRSSSLQHDGAPADYEENAWQWLKPTYEKRRIGYRGPIAWSPMNIFLWNILRSTFVQLLPELWKISWED